MCSKTHKNVLHGIVYEEEEYIMHQRNLARHIDYPSYFPGDTFNKLYREKFHVVHTLQCTWIIVFLSDYSKDDVEKDRCNLQNRLFAYHDHNYDDLRDAFEDRFPTKKKA
jgi:hypothetical protein